MQRWQEQDTGWEDEMAGPLVAAGAAAAALALRQAARKGIPLAVQHIRKLRKRIRADKESQRLSKKFDKGDISSADVDKIIDKLPEPKTVTRRYRKRMKRDYPDLRLKDRPRELARKFLEEHGYTEAMSGRKSQTFVERGDSVTAFTADSAGGIEQKTFTNPTLKQMRDWMGY